MSDPDSGILTQLKCRLFGHDWLYSRDRGTRRCHRCDHEEAYSVDEDHQDEGAAKFERRYQIRDGNLYIEAYTVTASGENHEYWQWFPTASGPADEAHLRQLKQEIEEHLETVAASGPEQGPETDADESGEGDR